LTPASPGDMLPHMRTSIEISDALMTRAKKVAAQRKVTFRQLAEEGLEMALSARGPRGRGGLRLVVYGDSKARAPELSWEAIREKVYPAR
jgi:hypothetical protein